MPRDRKPIQRLAEERRDAVAHESARYCDLQIDFLDERDDELIGFYGGRWDRQQKEYAPGRAPSKRVIRLHPGQIDAAKWFDEWIASYLAGDEYTGPKIFDALLAGGRRSGKSAFMYACAVAFACCVPGSTTWAVVPSENYLTEPCDYLEAIMLEDWYESILAPQPAYFLPNGSRIIIRSAHVPRKLKQGKADLVVINEGQAVVGQSYNTLSASIVDTGGLIMTAANPPDVGDPGDWVSDLAASAERGDTQHSKFFFFDPLLNPHIDQQALAALAEKMDPHTFDVQIRGLFLLRPDSVLHSWNRRENEKPIPQLGECTREFTKFFEGQAFDDIVSIDVQSFPWIAAIRLRAFRNPLDPSNMERAYLWGVGESFIQAGDEVDCAKDLIVQGCMPAETFVIMDASGDWQQAQRTDLKQRANYRGKGSMDMLRGEGFRHVVPPDSKMKANPDIADRCRAANARIGSKAGSRFVFIDPVRCPMTVNSIRNWKTRPSGMPSRMSKAAHAGDALSYAVWRFFPRRGETSKVEVQTMKRFGGEGRLKGF